jgi:hypothetical protein
VGMNHNRVITAVEYLVDELLPLRGCDESASDEPHSDDEVPPTEITHQWDVLAGDVVHNDPNEAEQQQGDHGRSHPASTRRGGPAFTAGRGHGNSSLRHETVCAEFIAGGMRHRPGLGVSVVVT